MLWNTLYLFDIDVRAILNESTASTSAYNTLLCPSGGNVINSNVIWMYPYHPHNMKIVKHLTCVWHWCVSHLTCVSCLNYCTTMLWFCPRKVRTRNLGTNFQNLSQHKRNVIRTYPYKHPLHTPYDGYETPSVCFSLMWEPSWMGIASTTAQAQCCFSPLGW
jgi:hypothetical protein